MIDKTGDPVFIFWPKKLDYCQTVKHQHPSSFLSLYQIHLNTDQSSGWQPLLAGLSKKERCHEIIQNQTRSEELIRYKPSIFSCCSNTPLYSPCYVTPSYILLYHPTLFFFSFVCLTRKSLNTEPVSVQRNLIHWYIMTLYTRTDVTISCYNVMYVNVTHLNDLEWSDHHV